MMRLRGLTLLAALGVVGCGSNERRQTITTADGARVEATTRNDGDGTTLNVTGANGEKASFVAGDSARWPTDWPEFAPAYPGAKVLSSMAGSSKDGKGGMVSFSTGDSPEKVLAFYQSRAEASGIKQVMNVQSGATRQFSAGDEASGRSLNVSATSEGGETQVTVLAGMK